ncbi:MAG: hypothetical protein AABY22_19415 [Nanoarchaeota archaeon]
MAKEVSESGSLKGWSFKVWFSKNKGTLRTLVAVVLGLAVSLGTDLSAMGKTGIGASVTLVAKLALDSLDFWFSDVKLE